MGRGGYRLGLYEKAMPAGLPWREKLAAARAAGFDYIEISIDETEEKLSRLDMTPEERLGLTAMMSAAGIRVETMCLSGHRRFPLGSEDEDTRAHSLRIMEKAILFARDLGISIIQIAGYDEYYHPSNEQTRRHFAENLRRCVDFSAEYGIILAFETMETPFLNTVEKAMAWVREIASPYLQVYPDSGNITNAALAAGNDVLDDIRAGHGSIAALHLKETVPGRFREVPFGAGHVDFAGIVGAAYAIGVRRFTGEFWYAGGDAWQEALREAERFLRGRIAAGIEMAAIA